MTHHLFSQLVTQIDSTSNNALEQLQQKLDVDDETLRSLISLLQQLDFPIVRNENNKIFLTQKITPLAIELIKTQLTLPTLEQLDFLPIFITLDSTNQHLKKSQKELSKKTRICLSEHQTSGRGRQSKQWVSPLASNIYLSLHAAFDISLTQIGGISLMVGISLVEGLTKLGIPGLRIKWPNDIYWNDKKLAGILIESTKIADNDIELIVGIGINVDMPEIDAKQIDQAWVDLKQITGSEIDRNIVISAILEQLVTNMAKYEEHGLQAFMSQWQALDYLLHKEITVKFPDGKEKQGSAQGINEQGELLLLENGHIVPLHAGDISVRKVSE